MTDNLNPWLGTFELALFMRSGVLRFPRDLQTAKWSFLVPLCLIPLYVYPLYAVPTEVMGARGYGELLSIHLGIALFHYSIFYFLLYLVMDKLGKKDSFWPTITMANYCAMIEFVLIVPLFAMVMAGYHSWEEVFAAFLLVSYYGLAVAAFLLTQALRVPWQFGTAMAFVSMFVHDGVFNTITAICGITT